MMHVYTAAFLFSCIISPCRNFAGYYGLMLFCFCREIVNLVHASAVIDCAAETRSTEPTRRRQLDMDKRFFNFEYAIKIY
jgi:hypothetical protein